MADNNNLRHVAVRISSKGFRRRNMEKGGSLCQKFITRTDGDCFFYRPTTLGSKQIRLAVCSHNADKQNN